VAVTHFVLRTSTGAADIGPNKVENTTPNRLTSSSCVTLLKKNYAISFAPKN
jgi:hypothetical protein